MEINLFTEEEHQYLREHLGKLPAVEFEIVVKRYWERLTLQEIAEDFDLSWNTVDRLFRSALAKLSEYCFADSRFSLRRNNSQNGLSVNLSSPRRMTESPRLNFSRSSH